MFGNRDENVLVFVCKNCKEQINKTDKYCKFCGTEVGKGKYESRNYLLQCVYGPMPEYKTQQCPRCGKLLRIDIIYNNDKYCHECGEKLNTK